MLVPRETKRVWVTTASGWLTMHKRIEFMMEWLKVPVPGVDEMMIEKRWYLQRVGERLLWRASWIKLTERFSQWIHECLKKLLSEWLNAGLAIEDGVCDHKSWNGKNAKKILDLNRAPPNKDQILSAPAQLWSPLWRHKTYFPWENIAFCLVNTALFRPLLACRHGIYPLWTMWKDHAHARTTISARKPIFLCKIFLPWASPKKSHTQCMPFPWPRSVLGFWGAGHVGHVWHLMP